MITLPKRPGRATKGSVSWLAIGSQNVCSLSIFKMAIVPILYCAVPIFQSSELVLMKLAALERWRALLPSFALLIKRSDDLFKTKFPKSTDKNQEFQTVLTVLPGILNQIHPGWILQTWRWALKQKGWLWRMYAFHCSGVSRVTTGHNCLSRIYAMQNVLHLCSWQHSSYKYTPYSKASQLLMYWPKKL